MIFAAPSAPLRQEMSYVVHIFPDFDGVDASHEDTWQSPGGLFLHVGHCNFQTYEISCLHLVPLHYDYFSHQLKLQCGETALEVRMFAEFARDKMDFGKAYNVQFYRTVLHANRILHDDEMLPGLVDVKKESTAFRFWKGELVETKSTKKRKNVSQRDPHPVQKGGARKPRPRPASQVDQLEDEDADVVVEEFDQEPVVHEDDSIDAILERLCEGIDCNVGKQQQEGNVTDTDNDEEDIEEVLNQDLDLNDRDGNKPFSDLLKDAETSVMADLAAAIPVPEVVEAPAPAHPLAEEPEEQLDLAEGALDVAGPDFRGLAGVCVRWDVTVFNFSSSH